MDFRTKMSDMIFHVGKYINFEKRSTKSNQKPNLRSTIKSCNHVNN